ncbi:MAG TPA: hypothetical protein VD948_09955 [Rhodothermales bacterium]|nr:hypothetical protein [Rhodothermales bacterium]
MPINSRRLLAVLGACALLLGVATWAHAQQPAPDKLVGRYEAARFRVTRGGQTTDLRCFSGALRVDMTADGIIAGDLTMRPTPTAPAVTTQLKGTYTASGTNVTLQTQSPTFFSGQAWAYSPGGILKGTFTSGDATYEVELQRQ